MPKNKKPASPARPSNPPTAEAAFGRVVGEVAKLDPMELVTINLDIPHGVSISLGALPRIREYAEDLKALPGMLARHVDMLEDYILGAWFAHLQALPGTQTQSQLRSLIEKATALRTVLLGDADALVRRGVFEAQAVAAIRAGQGHMDLANDLVALSAMFVQAADAIAGRTFATREEIALAGRLGPELIAALGVRTSTGVTTPTEAADRRARAYTLFVRAYGEVRRGLSYLRWHEGDMDQIAPSLYRGRGGRSSGTTNDEPVVDAAPHAEEAVPAPEAAPELVAPGTDVMVPPPPAPPVAEHGPTNGVAVG